MAPWALVDTDITGEPPTHQHWASVQEEHQPEEQSLSISAPDNDPRQNFILCIMPGQSSGSLNCYVFSGNF